MDDYKSFVFRAEFENFAQDIYIYVKGCSNCAF